MNLKIYIQKQTNRISILSWLYYFYLNIMEEKSVLKNPTKMGKQIKFYIQSKRYYELKHLQQ